MIWMQVGTSIDTLIKVYPYSQRRGSGKMCIAGDASQNIRFLFLDKNESQISNFKNKAQTKPVPFCLGSFRIIPTTFLLLLITSTNLKIGK